MRKCEDCRIILDEAVRYCPKCGKIVTSEEITPHTVASTSVPSLLVSANLHRIRQEWDAAVNDATEALRLDPNNPDIPSVLGEIYEQRDMLEDALIWSQMALELNKNSTADQARLERISKRLSESSARGRDHFGIFQKHAKLWAIILGGFFLLLIIVAVFLQLNGRNRAANSLDVSLPATPYAEGRSSESEPLAQPRTGPTPRIANGSSDLSLSGGGSSEARLRTPGEAKIATDLQSVQEAGAKVDDVIADPRQGTVIVTFSVPAGTASKSIILSAAVALAKAVFASNAEAKSVTARCTVSAGTASSTQIAFVGDVNREALASPTSTQPTDPTTVFTAQWWNPQMR